jgi:dTDP-4-dehydrorhamnose reductase
VRLLILGGDGMLGHKAFQVLGKRFEVDVTFRERDGLWQRHPIYAGFDRAHVLGGVDAANLASVSHALDQVKPDAVINCIGIIKQRDEAKTAIPAIQINSLFPHQLADLCAPGRVRLVHISTDCVFSGARGKYSENDLADPSDLYGRSKLLGELNRSNCLTLRTSMIGWELKHRLGLLEWFAAQRGRTIKGYRRAIYSGLSTTALADLIGDLLKTYPNLEGLYHVASEPISKYDLLVRLRDTLGWHDIRIEADDDFKCDRSLDGSRFEDKTGWRAPQWDAMIQGLAGEWDTYAQWRKSN